MAWHRAAAMLQACACSLAQLDILERYATCSCRHCCFFHRPLLCSSRQRGCIGAGAGAGGGLRGSRGVREFSRSRACRGLGGLRREKEGARAGAEEMSECTNIGKIHTEAYSEVCNQVLAIRLGCPSPRPPPPPCRNTPSNQNPPSQDPAPYMHENATIWFSIS